MNLRISGEKSGCAVIVQPPARDRQGLFAASSTTPRRRHGPHVIKHAAERAKVELCGSRTYPGCAAPEGTTGLQRRPRSAMRAGAPFSVSGVTLTASARRACRPSRWRPARAGRQGAGDDRRRLESSRWVQARRAATRTAWSIPGVQEHVPGIYHAMITTADTGGRALQDHREYQDDIRCRASCAPRRPSRPASSTTRSCRWKPRCWSRTRTPTVSKKTVKLTKDEGNRPDTNKEASPSCSR